MEATIDPIYFVSEYTVVLKDNETGKLKLEKASVENFDRDFGELVKKYDIKKLCIVHSKMFPKLENTKNKFKGIEFILK